jgi:hypothetical protein
MLRRLQNNFISFKSLSKDLGDEIQSIEGGNVKGVECLHGLDEQGI